MTEAPPSAGERFAAGFDRLSIGLGSISAVGTLCMIVLITLDLILRNFFSAALPGGAEINITLLVILVYLGLAGAQAKREHFAVVFLVDLLPRRARWVTDIVVLVLTAAIAGFLAYLTWGSAMDSFAIREASWGIVAVPIWPGRLIVSIGCGLLCAQSMVDIARLALRGPSAKTTVPIWE